MKILVIQQNLNEAGTTPIFLSVPARHLHRYCKIDYHCDI